MDINLVKLEEEVAAEGSDDEGGSGHSPSESVKETELGGQVYQAAFL